MIDLKDFWTRRTRELVEAPDFNFDFEGLFQILWDEGAPRWFLRNIDASQLEEYEQRQQIDGYRVVRFIDEGGMGQVFECVDSDLQRTVILKRPFPGVDCPANSALWRPGFPQARYLDKEARMTARFNHFGIVTIHRRVRDENGLEYYVMNPVNGETLETHIRKFHAQAGTGAKLDLRAPAVRDVLNRFATVCDIVAYLHEQGVLHRDLKPSNIMLGDFGRTFVIDLGLAREINLDNELGEHLIRISCTPAYLAPECYEGVETHGRDVYALGAVLYELLTGEPPARTDKPEHSANIQQGSFFIAAPKALNRSIPQRLEAICLKAMAHPLETRYGGRGTDGASELAKDVRNWLADEPIHAIADTSYDRVARFVRRNTRAFITVTTLTAVAAVLVSFLYSSLIFENARATKSAKIASGTLQKVVMRVAGPLILNPAARELHRAIMAESDKALDELVELSPDLIVHSTRAELFLLQATSWHHQMNSERDEEQRKVYRANRDRYFAQAVAEADLGMQKKQEDCFPVWVRAQTVKARMAQKEGDSASGIPMLEQLLVRLGEKPDPNNYDRWSKKDVERVQGIDNVESNLAEALEEAKRPKEAVATAMHVLTTPVKYQSADHKMAAATVIFFSSPDTTFGHILAWKAHKKTLSDIDKQVSAVVLRQDPKFQVNELDLIDRTADLENDVGTKHVALLLWRRALQGYDGLMHSPGYVPNVRLVKARGRIFSYVVELLIELDQYGDELEEHRKALVQRLRTQISNEDLAVFQNITHQILRHKIVSKSASTGFAELVSEHKSQIQQLTEAHADNAIAQKAFEDLLGLLQTFERLFHATDKGELTAAEVDAEFLEGGTFPAEVLFRIQSDRGNTMETAALGDTFYQWSKAHPEFAFKAAKQLGYMEQSVGATSQVNERIADLLRIATTAKLFESVVSLDELICGSTELAPFRGSDIGQNCIVQIAREHLDESELDLAKLNRLNSGLGAITNPTQNLSDFKVELSLMLNQAMQDEASRQDWKLDEYMR